jgi:hypothetical protein
VVALGPVGVGTPGGLGPQRGSRVVSKLVLPQTFLPKSANLCTEAGTAARRYVRSGAFWVRSSVHSAHCPLLPVVEWLLSVVVVGEEASFAVYRV